MGRVLVTVTSADTPSVAGTVVEALFAGFGSVVVEETVAVFTIVDPVEPDTTLAISVNPAEAPDARAPLLQTTVAPPAQLNEEPEFWVIELNVVPAGSASVKDTDAAFDGPLFETVME